MYKRSIEDPAGFWSEIAAEFYWKQKWGHKVCDENFDVRKGNIKIEVIDLFPSSILGLVFALLLFLFFLLTVFVQRLSVFVPCVVSLFSLVALLQWFKGGITNICYNCLDRNVEAGLGDKVAIYWEGNEPGLDGNLTYTQLLHQVCQVCSDFSLSAYNEDSPVPQV